MARKRQTRTIALKRRVSWADADPAGIMNTPRAFDYAVDVMEVFYLKVLGFSFGELITKHGMGNPFVHIEADFHAPLVQGKPLTLTVAVERLGRSSISWRVDARRADRRLAFRVKAVSTFIRNDTFRPVPIPAAWHKKLSRYLPA